MLLNMQKTNENRFQQHESFRFANRQASDY